MSHKFAVTLMLVLFGWLLRQPTYAQYQLSHAVIGGGGGTASSPNHAIEVTAGEAVIGNALSASNQLAAGFWHIYNLNMLTAIDDNRLLPIDFLLEQNYPNPFNPGTTIKFALPTAGNVVLEVYNLLGERVGRLVNGQMDAGIHEVQFNAGNLASGIYIYRITATALSGSSGGTFTDVKKMILLK